MRSKKMLKQRKEEDIDRIQGVQQMVKFINPGTQEKRKVYKMKIIKRKGKKEITEIMKKKENKSLD